MVHGPQGNGLEPKGKAPNSQAALQGFSAGTTRCERNKDNEHVKLPADHYPERPCQSWIRCQIPEAGMRAMTFFAMVLQCRNLAKL